MTFLEINEGDIVRLRKQHACGGWEWTVVRTGADIGIVCRTCQHRVLIPRDKFRRAVKTLTPAVPPSPAESDLCGVCPNLIAISMPDAPHEEGFLPILRLSAFRRLWLSQMLALTAQNGIHFVQLVLIEHLTGRSLHIGLMIVAFSIPPVLLSFLAGVVVDRVPKKWIISVSNILRTLLALAYIPVLRWMDGTELLWAVYIITFISSGIGVFNNPAVLAKIPLLVGEGEERLITANSLFNITIAASQIVGLIALAPVAVKATGIGGGFVVMAICYFLAFIFDLGLPRDPVRRVKGVTASSGWRQMVGELHDGWSFVVKNRYVSISLVQLILISTLIMILAMIAPGFSARVLGMTPEDAVFVFAPTGVGMLIAMVFLGRWGTQLPQERLQTGMLVMAGVGFAILGFLSRDYSAMRIPIFDVYPERLAPITGGGGDHGRIHGFFDLWCDHHRPNHDPAPDAGLAAGPGVHRPVHVHQPDRDDPVVSRRHRSRLAGHPGVDAVAGRFLCGRGRREPVRL